MDIIGIICEYNPFHNGHIYHLNKIKELYPNSLIVLVMSSSFTQRGIPSILNKWDKTEIALNNNIDLVIELPFVYSTQSADIFAKGAISILKELKVNYLVFGSENNNVDELINLVKLTDTKEYNDLVKIELDKGINYPTALNNSLKKLTNKSIETPNDLLAFSYIKEIYKQNTNIKPIAIKRTNDFHSTNIEEISSATSIRKGLLEHNDIKKAVPQEVYNKIINSKHLENNYFTYLKYKINTTNDLSIYQTVDEGIENRIIKYINEVESWEELVEKIKTKRYTYNKINRMLTHILCGFTKELAKSINDVEYIRILGFNKKGQSYLNSIKKDNNLIITNYKKDISRILDFEKQVTCVYAEVLNEKDKNNLIKSELNKPIIKE